MEGIRSPSPDIKNSFLKNIFLDMLSNTSLDLISDMGATDHRHYIDNIESKIENLYLRECSLKNRSFWKLVISLEAYMNRESNFRIMLYRRLNLF